MGSYDPVTPEPFVRIWSLVTLIRGVWHRACIRTWVLIYPPSGSLPKEGEQDMEDMPR